MVSKNNRKLLREKQSNKVYKYAIKRMTFGVASVAVAAGLLFAGGTIASAEEAPAGGTPSEEISVSGPASAEANGSDIGSTDEAATVSTESNVEEPKEEPAQDTVEDTQAQDTVEDTQAQDNVEQIEDVKDLQLSEAQKARLRDAGYTDQEIASIEAEAKAKKQADENFDVDAFVAQKVAAKRQIQTRSAEPELELSEEAEKEAVEAENGQVGTATREAAAPEESEVTNDSRNAVHAFVGVQTGGDMNLLLAGATGQQFKPIEGVRGFFQWFEDGGYVSPIYTAVSDANGRLNIGAKPYIAGDGKLIKFDADPTVSGGNERYRFWVDQATIPEGYQLQYITGEQVVFPNQGLTITQGGSGSDTPKNTHENWKILLMQKPKAEMHREDAKETPVQSNTGGYMTGKVSWDYSSGAGGVQWNTVAHHTTPAPDVTVRASYLSDYAMKQIYSAETARLMGVSDASKIRGRGWTSAQEAELQKWVKEQVAKDPTKWIAETVTAKTNAEGRYILQFNGIWGYKQNAAVAQGYTEQAGKSGWTQQAIDRLGNVATNANDGSFADAALNYNEKHINYDWMFVSTDDTDGLRVMTPYNNNYYASMNSDWGIHSGWSGTGFGVGVTNALTRELRSDFVFGINNVNFNITNYDSGANTALPGDVAETKTTGLPYSKTSERFRIVWYDHDGNVVKNGKAVQPDGTGQIPSEPFDTKDVKKTSEFTAKLFRVDKNGKDKELIAVDSFVVQISNLVASRYDKYEIKHPNPQEGATYGAEGLPDGLSINPKNGTISGKPTKAGEYSVKITTTIQDEAGKIKGSRYYTAVVTDSPLENGEVGVAYNHEVKPQAIEGYVFKNVTSKFIDGKAIDGLTIENNQITGTPTKEVPATQTTDDGSMGPNVEVTYDIYKLNEKGEEVLIKKGHTDKVPLLVTKEGEATKYDPSYTAVDGKVGEEATVAAPTFTDKEGNPATPENVTYELGEGAPTGAKVNADGSVTYTPVDGDAGKAVHVPVVVKYSDGTTDNATATINVAAKDTTAPVITADNVTAVEGKEITPVPVTTDDEKATVTVENLPEGLTYNPESKQIEGTVPKAEDWGDKEEKTVTATVKAVDEAGNESTEDITVTIQRDTDGDGMPDVTDPDDDNDGATDEEEKEKGTDPKDPNSKPD
ncbi:putative Ig domain-containing protein, partial [Eremococcus coleocola]